jgi:D-sedoheptulose 7-phosphate isomerase
MNDGSEYARRYLDGLKRVLDQLPLERLDPIVELLVSAHREGRQVFIIGNGGSAATASHMMNDLAKGTIGHKADAPWPALRAVALTDNVPLMTAWANDTDYSRIFAGPLQSLARPGDLLIAISASGNSPNIVAAAQLARERGMRIIGLTGFGGGQLAGLADAAFVVPSDDYGPVEDVHMILDHILTGCLREKLKAAHAKP